MESVSAILQGYAVITVLRNNFDNGWIGFDERTSSQLEATEESGRPLWLTLRRQSSMALGQLVVSLAIFCFSGLLSIRLRGIEAHQVNITNMRRAKILRVKRVVIKSSNCFVRGLSLWLIGTVRAEPETVISRAWVQSPDPTE